MKPPICEICYDRFFNGGGLIYFKEDENDSIFNKRFDEEGFVGHPSNAFWFCEKHYPKAKALSHLTKEEAFLILKREAPLKLKKDASSITKKRKTKPL